MFDITTVLRILPIFRYRFFNRFIIISVISFMYEYNNSYDCCFYGSLFIIVVNIIFLIIIIIIMIIIIIIIIK